MAAAASALDKVIEKHLQELGFLAGQRMAALRSPDYRLRNVKALNGRIEAHLDGLRIAGKTAPELLAEHLQGDAEWIVFAAALALLQLQTPEAAAAVVQALLAAEPEQVKPLRQALLQGPIEGVEDSLRAAADSAPPHVAAAALEALVHHGCNNVNTRRLTEFVRHEMPDVRAAGWRIAACGEPVGRGQEI